MKIFVAVTLFLGISSAFAEMPFSRCNDKLVNVPLELQGEFQSNDGKIKISIGQNGINSTSEIYQEATCYKEKIYHGKKVDILEVSQLNDAPYLMGKNRIYTVTQIIHYKNTNIFLIFNDYSAFFKLANALPVPMTLTNGEPNFSGAFDSFIHISKEH